MYDLWPEDIGYSNIKSPLTILKEQASYLGAKTKNLVNGEVRIVNKRQDDLPELPLGSATPDDSSRQIFSYNFYITAPALKNYRYRLFTIYFDIGLYPVEFLLDGEIQRQLNLKQKPPRANSESEYTDMLGKIFNSDRTRLVINSLISQSGGLNSENQPSSHSR